MEITVDIFSGFLGAGKTLLIKKMLKEKFYNSNTVIIENEFGEVGIDGLILKESNVNIKEITSGCICCEVSNNFGAAVLEILNKYSPDYIVIEPSGVAKLSEILKILNEITFKDKIKIRNIFTIIDIKNYSMYMKNFSEFYDDQIKEANKIVLSRTQFVDEEQISWTIQSIKKINKKSEIIYKPWNELKASDFSRMLPINNNKYEENKEKSFSLIKSNIKKTIRKKENHNAKSVFESYPIELPNVRSIEELENKFNFLLNNSKYGNIIRAKGFIKESNGGYYQFDYVFNEFKARKIKWSNKIIVSIIGNQLNKNELIKLFK